MNNFFDVRQSQIFIRESIIPSNNIIIKIKNKLLRLLDLRIFFQGRFDKFIPYRKYLIKSKFLPLNIEKEISEYNKIDF